MKLLLSLLMFCAAAFADEPAPKFIPEPAAKATPRDAAVIDAALADLLADKDALPFTRKPGVTRIILDTDSSGRIYETQLDADLSGEKWKLPPDIRADMKRRNTRAASLREMRFGKHVTVRATKDITKKDFLPSGKNKLPKARGYAGIHLPGYSKEGTQAVVYMWFGPTPHGASAAYLLVLKDGKWVVKERVLSFYA